MGPGKRLLYTLSSSLLSKDNLSSQLHFSQFCLFCVYFSKIYDLFFVFPLPPPQSQQTDNVTEQYHPGYFQQSCTRVTGGVYSDPKECGPDWLWLQASSRARADWLAWATPTSSLDGLAQRGVLITSRIPFFPNRGCPVWQMQKA